MLEALQRWSATMARATAMLRVHSERAPRALAAGVTNLVESAMDAIITVDERQHIVLFNAAAEAMFG